MSMNMFNLVLKIIKKIFLFISPDKRFLRTSIIFQDILLYPRLLFLRLTRKTVQFNTFSIKKVFNRLNQNDLDDLKLNAKNIPQKELIEKSSRILSKFGLVIIENAFDKEQVENFCREIEGYIDLSNKNIRKIPLVVDKFLLSPVITNTIDLSCNIKNLKKKEFAYVRQFPIITKFITTDSNYNEHWTSGWHVDFPTQFTATVLLKDLPPDSTRMQALPLTNSLPLIPGKHYDLDKNYENLNKTKKIVNFYGPKGTLYIHSGNTLHRAFGVPGTNRYLWGAIYTLDKVFPKFSQKELSEFFENSKSQIENLSEENTYRLEAMLNNNEPTKKQQMTYV